MSGRQERMIDRWFPVGAVDEACGTPAGSGLTEKALFSWFASRPIAQARAAALTALLPDGEDLRRAVDGAVRTGDSRSLDQASDAVREQYGGTPPIVLDMFSGRGIIPLEVARAGGSAVGIDLSRVATLAGRLLADYPSRNWSQEPHIASSDAGSLNIGHGPDRLVKDVETVLRMVDALVVERVASFYPRNAAGEFPWGYLWVTTLPCDECKRRFPLIGDLRLRVGMSKSDSTIQSLRILHDDRDWWVEVIEGLPNQPATYASAMKDDGKKKKGKSARCVFCNHSHSLDNVKAKCESEEGRDVLVAVADEDTAGRRVFRLPTGNELAAAASAATENIEAHGPYSALPDEVIPSGNVHTVMGSGYGCKTFSDLMVPRQARLFAETVASIRQIHSRLTNDIGVSREYAAALASYAASNLCRRLRRSTRGAALAILRGGVSDIFTNESKINFGFDSFETGPGGGAGTWSSVAKSTVRALRKIVTEQRGAPARLIQGSATALPMRDGSVDLVITDPPYRDMIEYADASDMFFVWLKRILYDIEPDLFGADGQEPDGLQNKNDEIIVRRVHEPNRVKHDIAFYENMLAKAFGEARRVLKADGHLVVIFGHSDPDAWRRLLGALHQAGFVVTSAWPSRTESGDATVASIKVTVTIGCRVATAKRPVGIASEVDREVVEAVAGGVKHWDEDGLAVEDQLMASYGPAMEVFGRYSRIINPDGSESDLDHFLALARRAVRDAMSLRVDHLPLETFDALTRFAIFWLRAKRLSEVPKGEARFFAQADELRLDDLRGRILLETDKGFKLELRDEKPVNATSSVFEVVRAMAHAWDVGGMESVATVLSLAETDPSNDHLWAVVSEFANNLPASDRMAKALAGIKRSFTTISTIVKAEQAAIRQEELFKETGV